MLRVSKEFHLGTLYLLLIFLVISRYAAVYTNDFVKATNHRGMEISERF